VAADVYDAHIADLAIAAAAIPGQRITISCSALLAPGTVAVMESSPSLGRRLAGFLDKFGPGKPRAGPPVTPAEVKMTPPRPPKPRPMPPSGPPPRPQPRVRIVDT
jgi:hypothetical protein